VDHPLKEIRVPAAQRIMTPKKLKTKGTNHDVAHAIGGSLAEREFLALAHPGVQVQNVGQPTLLIVKSFHWRSTEYGTLDVGTTTRESSNSLAGGHEDFRPHVASKRQLGIIIVEYGR